MSTLWEKTKIATQKAAAATSRAAQRTKLKAEIMSLNRDVSKAKAEFGVAAFDLVVAGDLSGAQRIANEKRIKIDNWKNLIAAKRAEIARLNEEARQAGDKMPEKSMDGGEVSLLTVMPARGGLMQWRQDEEGNVVI